MKAVFLLTGSVLLFLAGSEEPGTLIFHDTFDRSESQEASDEPGNGWGTNSKSRAKENKQVDLVEGTMRVFIHSAADHAVSVTHPFEFTNGAVAVRFKLEDERDSIGLNFADLQCKEVHAGHLFVAKVSAKQVQLQDLKTGNMRLDIRTARQAKEQLTKEQQQALVGKQKSFAHDTEIGEWHELLVSVHGDELSVTLDNEPIGSLRSPGMAHPTKRLLRLAVPRNVVVDDVRIWRRS
jgi:hypothetical protein